MNLYIFVLALGFILEILGLLSMIFIHKAHINGKELTKLKWFMVFSVLIIIGSGVQSIGMLLMLKH